MIDVREWRIDTEWPKPPLSMNDRLHPHAKARKTRLVRDTAAFSARAAGVPALAHVTVQMVWIVPDLRVRDEENPVATLKPFCDGLVDAGVVPDDSPHYMTKHMPEIRYVKGGSRVYFLLSDEVALA